VKRPGGISDDDCVGLDVASHDGPCPDERSASDADPARDHGSRTERGAAFDSGRKQLPVVLALEHPLRGCAWVLVVDENDAVAHEDLVLDLDTAADEGVALNLAVGADANALLDLDERPDAGVVTDLAAVEIGERIDDHVLAEDNVVDQTMWSVVRWRIAHLRRVESGVNCPRSRLVSCFRGMDVSSAGHLGETANRFSIICLSPQDWRVALPTNRQHVMFRAARRGHQVLFVETGYFVGRHLWALLRGPDRVSLARRLFTTEKIAAGLALRKAVNVLPWGSKYRLPKAVNSGVTARLLRRLAAGLPQPVVLWIYDPGAIAMAGSCGEAFAVYDCVDDYAEQTNSERRRELIAECDRLAATRSQLVFTTSSTMYERQHSRNAATHLVPNAGDYEHFVKAGDRAFAAPEVRDLPRPVLGFVGNFLASKVDFGLLEQVARGHPAATLVLIGPPGRETGPALERLARLPNIRWLGPKPYEELPRYVAAFDVGLIPYVSNAYTRSCFPLKLYEYLAAGKPVVASGLPELAGMEPDVTLASDASRFIDAVKEAVEHDHCEADRVRRRHIASQNSWDAKTDRLLGLVDHELRRETAA
jgi:glycosyltransferase involved in cell wall biosynthesis